jgi:hypothetical protein
MKFRTHHEDGEKNLPPLSPRGRGLIPTRGRDPSLSSLALSRSLSVSLSQVHTEANAEHKVGVALDGVAEGWVAVERKVALPPPPRRAVRGIRLLHQVSSPLLEAPPSLSLPPLISVLIHCARCRVPWHADNGALLELTDDVQIWKAMSEYAVAPVSSGGSGGSSLK